MGEAYSVYLNWPDDIDYSGGLDEIIEAGLEALGLDKSILVETDHISSY